jgi:hypothetical protein
MFTSVKISITFLVLFIEEQQDLHYQLQDLIKKDIYHCEVEMF